MSPSDDLPYWTYESLHESDALEERLQVIIESIDKDDMDYPPVNWESGVDKD